MKKKFVRVMLFGALTLAVSTTVTSCKDYDDDIKGLQEQVDNITSNNPVSTEDMKAAVDEATKALEKKVKDLQDIVDGKVTTSDLEAKIKDLETKLAAGDKTVADALTTAKNDLKLLISGKADQSVVDGIKGDIEKLQGMQATLQSLIDAEKKYKESGDLSGFENTSFDKFVNQSILNALKDEEGNKGAIATYVTSAIQTNVLSKLEAIDTKVATLFGTGVENLSDFITKIHTDIYGENGISEQIEALNDLLEAIDAYVGTGENKYEDYSAIIDQINDSKDKLAALNVGEGKSLDAAVKEIIATELGDEKATLAKLQSELKAEIAALKGMIQSIVYVPESADRTINFASLQVLEGFSASNEFINVSNTKFEKKVKFRVAPASAVQYLVSGEKQKYDISIDAQKLTRATTPFSITKVAAVDGEDNLIEVTMTADDAFATVNGFATSLVVKGKEVAEGENKVLSDLSSDYFAIVKQAVYIVDVAYSYENIPTSLTKGTEESINFGKGIVKFITVPTAADKSDDSKKTAKTATELGINANIATVAFAMTGTNASDNFDFNDNTLKPKATGTAGQEATITPTITIAEQSKEGDGIVVKLIEKSEKVDLVVAPVTWAGVVQTIEMTEDNLNAIKAAISTPAAADLSAIESITNNKSTAENNAITFELANETTASAAITLNVPASAASQTVTATLKLPTKEINLTAVITVNETTADVFKWVRKPLLGDGPIPLTINAGTGTEVTAVSLTADLSDIYTDFATWKTMASAAKKQITLECVAAPKIGTIDNAAYNYSLPATVSLPKGTESVSSIDVAYNVMCNKTSLNPADKANVVTFSVPAKELNGNFMVPNEKHRVKDVKDAELSASYEVGLTTAFNPTDATGDKVDAEKNPKLLWNDMAGKAMWPEADATKYANNKTAFAQALPIYGLGISFEPTDDSKTIIETYFDKTELVKGNLKFSTEGIDALPNTLIKDLVVKLKVVATSKWGTVTNTGTEFTVTFKAGCTVSRP